MNYGGTVPIYDRKALTPEIFLGASGTFSGLSLSANLPISVTGTVTAIRDSTWALITVQQADGDVFRIRIA